MDDLISRKWLIECVEEGWIKFDTEKDTNIYIHLVRDIAPSVEAEPVRHGHWIPMNVSSGSDSWKCSLCGRRARGVLNNLPYCHCGARMDGE